MNPATLSRPPSRTKPHPEPQPPTYLRPRQKEAFKAVFGNLAKGIDSMLVALPTGVGKTHLALAIAQQFEHVLFLVHRGELLKQTLGSYIDAGYTGKTTSITSKNRKPAPDAHLTVGMIQTLAGRLDQYAPSRYDLVITDEAHHAMAKEWRNVIEHFTPVLNLGLSATPERQDGAPLSHLYPLLAYHMTVSDAVKEGALVNPVALEVQTGIDLSGVKRSRGDYDQAQLQSALNTPERNRLVLRTFLKNGRGRKAVAFTAGVQHAKDLAKTFSDAGVPAVAIAGTDSDREEKLKELENGKYTVAFNAMLLCLDEETEILTSQGWVGIDAMTFEHDVANWHMDTEGITFHRPRDIVRRERGASERMVTVESPDRSIRVTEGHWMVCRGSRDAPWEKRQARDIVGQPVRLPGAHDAHSTEAQALLSDGGGMDEYPEAATHQLRFEDGWRRERVWCVKTETRNIVTRRRGTVTIMGGSVAKIVKLEHAWRRLDGRNDDGFQVAPFPG